jgi:molybdate transport system substrate-binding protein
MKRLLFVIALLLGGTSPLTAQPASPEALRVLASNGVKAVVESLTPEIEHAVGRSLAIEFSTAASLKTDIEAGAAFDVAILTPAIIDDLIGQQRITADSRTSFARAGVGVGARKGESLGDVGTLEGLKSALLRAQSVAFTADGQSRATIDRAFEKLGIVEEMRAKTVLKGPGEAPAAVAAGEAELVLTLVSEILPVAGLELVGPFPAEAQGYIDFTAGRSPSARDAAAADALLAFLGTTRAREALRAHGMEPYAD